MNWYIGQPVIFIGRTGYGYTKNKEMVITGLKQCCDYVQVNADNVRVPYNTRAACPRCGEVSAEEGERYHLHEKNFAPLMDITELKEILNEEIQRI